MLTGLFLGGKIKIMNKEDAKKYIQEIIYSIERDVVAALNAFNKHNAINSTKKVLIDILIFIYYVFLMLTFNYSNPPKYFR